MIVIGLTGSIGMGKSAAGAMLESLGVPVHDSDRAVHALLFWDSPAWGALKAAFPYYKYPQIYRTRWSWGLWRNGFSPIWRFIDRKALGKVVFAKDEDREKLEAVLHPFVQEGQRRFIAAQRAKGLKIVALDIPLLFETGAENRVDVTITVTAPAFIQHARVLARPGMTPKKLSSIMQRQMPDGEKRARSDFVVHSGLGRAQMMKELKQALIIIRETHLGKKAA
jgi:dephospho-CoA kinase